MIIEMRLIFVVCEHISREKGHVLIIAHRTVFVFTDVTEMKYRDT